MSFGGNSTHKSNSRTPSKSPRNSLRKTYNHSPTNSSKVSQSGINEQTMCKVMNKNRQKLCNTLDAYVLIMQSNSPLRCLQHNSVLSLYCQTQQKLLCANCIYRNNTHRSHKVHPIQQCYRMLARDIQKLERQSQRQFQWFNQSSQKMHTIFKQQEQDATQALVALAQQFEETESQLRKYFEAIKVKIVNSLNKMSFEQQKLLLELGFYRQIFKENKLPKKQQMDNIDEKNLKYFHLIGNTLINYSKTSKHKVKYNQNIIKQIQNKEVRKLQTIKQNIRKWVSEKQKQIEKHSKIIQLQKEQPIKNMQKIPLWK